MYLGTYAKTQPDKIAVVRAATGEAITYRELDARSNRLAHLLRARGLQTGDHVALFMENNLVYFDVVCACMRSGLYITTINRYLTASEAAYIVDNCDAKALVVSSALDAATELGRLDVRCAVRLAAGDEVEGFESYEAAVAGQPDGPIADEAAGAFMLYSSGTTGRPKGILRPRPDRLPTQRDASMGLLTDTYGMDENTVYLSPAPMYHSAPVSYCTAVLQVGGTVVMMDRFDAAQALTLIERYQVTHSQWVPTMFVRFLKLDEATRSAHDLSSHRCAIHAAAPCPLEVKHRMIEWWGPILEEYYASTEGAGVTRISSHEWLAHPGSVGRSGAGAKPLHICDEQGRELAAGEVGLIYGEPGSVQPFVYYKDEAKTLSQRHPVHPQWTTVGDVGYLDEDGYLFLSDRKAFMIISGGVNIYPQQIEDVLALHPKLADVAVIGVPNADLGEEVKAVVELAVGVEPSDALAQEIMDFVRGRLGRQLTPRSVDFVEALPRLPTGKLYKKALKDRYWGETGAALPLAARS